LIIDFGADRFAQPAGNGGLFSFAAASLLSILAIEPSQ
jgi:hypothetical protein